MQQVLLMLPANMCYSAQLKNVSSHLDIFTRNAFFSAVTEKINPLAIDRCDLQTKLTWQKSTLSLPYLSHTEKFLGGESC